MSEYKTIHGIHVQALDTDPSNLGAGQVWYNTTSNQLKITAVSTSGSWATGGNMGTARYSLGSAGTQTAGLAFGGSTYTHTEHYDGSAWTAGGNMGTGRWTLAGAGTQTAGLGFGGYDGNSSTNATEHYDGSAWTGGGNMATARYKLAGAGTQTAGLGFGGYVIGSNAVVNATEEYTGPGIISKTVTSS